MQAMGLCSPFEKNSFLSYPMRGTARGRKTAREREKAAEPVMENPPSVTEQSLS